MDPGHFAAFAAEFAAEWNRLQAAAIGERAATEAELSRLIRQGERLIDAIADGTPASLVRERLATLERRQRELEAKIRAQSSPSPRLHPNLLRFIGDVSRS